MLVYTGTVETPCGEGLRGYPIFYCPANQTIYSSAGSIAEYGETVRLAGYWIAFHEYAHHVQRRIDVLAAAYTRDEDQLQISRRIELQADCFMAMTGIAMRTTRLSASDRDEMEAWRKAVPDEIHGKSASQLYWINRGFGTDDFGRCSTWTATKHSADGNELRAGFVRSSVRSLEWQPCLGNTSLSERSLSTSSGWVSSTRRFGWTRWTAPSRTPTSSGGGSATSSTTSPGSSSRSTATSWRSSACCRTSTTSTRPSTPTSGSRRRSSTA